MNDFTHALAINLTKKKDSSPNETIEKQYDYTNFSLACSGMEQCDLLVHVSAPARVQDDKKYLSIAQSIIDFEVVKVTTTNSPEEIGMERRDVYHLRSPEGAQTLSGFESSRLQTSSKEQGAYRSKVAASLANWPRTKPGSIVPSINRRSSTYNPPYKNPFHGFQSKVSPAEPRTPRQELRPKTAPDQLEPTVQVPFTDIGRRRAKSDSASFGSLSSLISYSPNTHPNFPFGSQPCPRSTIEESFVYDSMVAGKSLTRSFSEASLDDEPDRKRARICTEDHAALKAIQSRQHSIEPSFLRDRSLDWTSSLKCSAEAETDSLASTMSLSQPLPIPAKSVQVQIGSNSQPLPAIHVDLTFTDSSQERTSSGAPPSSHSESNASSSGENSTSSMSVQERGSLLFGTDLPDEAISADPPMGQTKFTSHITSSLADLAISLPFEKVFRPVEVKRDVKVLERGCWSMDVTIADAEVVEEARRSPTKAEKVQAFRDRFAGVSHDKRMKRYEAAREAGDMHDFDYGFENKAVGLLTKEEFVSFWRNLSLFIEDGKAGWGIRMVREDEILESPDTGSARIFARIRVFSWGEIIGHLYLAFFVLSDKVSSRIPMQWVAGDGTAVVEMAGTRAGRGKLGVWTRKGPDGEGGLWGVAEG